jgi:hypothetical protein
MLDFLKKHFLCVFLIITAVLLCCYPKQAMEKAQQIYKTIIKASCGCPSKKTETLSNAEQSEQ